jgi:hypothetical protein
VRRLLTAARDLEAVDAMEISRDRRSPMSVTIRGAWRNTRLCGNEHGLARGSAHAISTRPPAVF